MDRDYKVLKQLLDNEGFPMDYVHKFIGYHSERFFSAVASLEERHPKLELQTSRAGKSGKYLSLTYRFKAENADEIVKLIDETSQLEDVRTVL